METITYLTVLTTLLVFGIVASILALKFRIPDVLLLVFLGMALSLVTYEGIQVFMLPEAFATSLSVVALALIVFNASSRFKLKDFDAFSFESLKLTFVLLLFNLILFSLGVYYSMPHASLAAIFIFAAMMTGTSPDTVMSELGSTNHRAIKFMEVESVINTPIMVLFPFLIYDFSLSVTQFSYDQLFLQIVPFMQQIIVGIGTGVFISIIMFKVMRNKYSEKFSPLATIGIALASYILAEQLNGNGVLAVSTTGLFFGNLYLKEKENLLQFSAIITNFLKIMVFILVGLLITFPLNVSFFMTSASLYVLFLFIRFLALVVAVKDFTVKEKLFMSLASSKGIALAVVVTLMTTLIFPGLDYMLDLSLAFMIYSLIVSAITIRFSTVFIEKQVKPE